MHRKQEYSITNKRCSLYFTDENRAIPLLTLMDVLWIFMLIFMCMHSPPLSVMKL